MPDFVVGPYPHHARRAILDAVEDALAGFGAPVPGSGDVTVIVRCTAPEPEGMSSVFQAIHDAFDASIPPDRARGCATKVIP